MFGYTETQGPAGFLTAVTEQLAKLPSQLGGPPRSTSATSPPSSLRATSPG